MIYEKKENESTLDYAMRLVDYKKNNKPDDLDWEDIKNLLGLDINKDSLRKSQDTEFGGLAVYNEMIKRGYGNDTIYKNNIQEQIRELKKERIKCSDERAAYNKILRENARQESLYEIIKESLQQDFSVQIPEPLEIESSQNKALVLGIGDFHYGKEFCVYGLDGSVINAYSTEIFKERMWKLRDKILEISSKEGINEIHIFSLGDSIEGLLRISAIPQNSKGITQATIELSYFMISWLNNLSQSIYINYYQVNGNHDDLRLLTGKKGDFPTENMRKCNIKYD